jgi:hypothetical protein
MPLWSNKDEAESAPKHTVDIVTGNTGVQAYNVEPVGTFGVDVQEAQGAHAGWVLRTVGSGGRAGRVIQETLVAMGSMTGDGDSLPPLPVITIGTQPDNLTVADGGTAVFTVGASVTQISTLSYLWQVSTDSGSNWVDLTSATTDTLTLPGIVLADDGNQYRVIVSGTNGAQSVTSNVVTLTVTS